MIIWYALGQGFHNNSEILVTIQPPSSVNRFLFVDHFQLLQKFTQQWITMTTTLYNMVFPVSHAYCIVKVTVREGNGGRKYERTPAHSTLVKAPSDWPTVCWLPQATDCTRPYTMASTFLGRSCLVSSSKYPKWGPAFPQVYRSPFSVVGSQEEGCEWVQYKYSINPCAMHTAHTHTTYNDIHTKCIQYLQHVQGIQCHVLQHTRQVKDGLIYVHCSSRHIT